MVWSGNLNSSWKIKNYSVLPSAGLAPRSLDSITYFHSKVRLRLRERFRTIFILELSPVLGGAFVSQLAN